MTDIAKATPQRVEVPFAWDFTPRLLLAEDDAELRSFLAERFRSAGFDVVEAEDGTSVVECLADSLLNTQRGGNFDLVISDIRMPGFTAFDVLRSARGALQATPVILITGFGDRRTHERAQLLGAAAVFDKPLDVDDLIGAACRLLPQSQRLA
jgi:two-component system response regulator (stage 0 sporulation protein F)